MKLWEGRSLFLTIVFAMLMISMTGLNGCIRPSVSDPPSDNTLGAFSGGPAWPAAAILKVGEQPLWFEYTGEGPRLISSPGEASLSDYTPWPLSRFGAGMLAFDSSLVLAINRDGFLIISPTEEKGSAILYRAADPVNWDPYTIASVFIHEDSPAVLLRRDDFFSSSLAPALENPVFFLAKDHPKPIGVRVPALDQLSKDDGWEVNALRQGTDHNWYYRIVQTGYAQPGIVYYRTPDLSIEGKEINQEDFWNSSRSENEFHTLSFLGPLDASLTPGGQGLAVMDSGDMRFSLPELPNGFVYTAAGITGNILIAAWEEQEESAIGAAGFMALDTKALGLFTD